MAGHPQRPRGRSCGAEDENQNGREKIRRAKVRKKTDEPLGTNSLRTSSKRLNEYSLLIGQKTFLLVIHVDINMEPYCKLRCDHNTVAGLRQTHSHPSKIS